MMFGCRKDVMVVEEKKIIPKKVKPEKPHYVDNKVFLEAMREHFEATRTAKKNGTKPPQVSEYIGTCILNIASKLANRPNFINYPFRDDMIADGIENCLQYLNNFNPNKSNNPFSYFTQIIYFAFLRKIQKEKKQLYAKYKAIEQTLMHDIHDEDLPTVTKYGNDHSDAFMHEFVDHFEKVREEKRSKGRKNRQSNKADLNAVLDEKKKKE